MRLLFCIFTSFFLAASAYSQETTVVKKIFASPGPNLFYENPSVVVNEKNRSAQVVWERHPGNHPDHATLTRKISPQGVAKGSERTLIGGTNTYDPSVLYNKNKNEFVVIYADEFQNPVHTIFVQRLNAKGQKIGTPVQVSTDTGSAFVNQNPFAAFDPGTKNYLLVWSRNSTTQGSFAGEGIYAAVLNENLVTVAGPTLLLPENPAIGQNPQIRDLAILTAGRVVVAYTEPVGADPQLNHYYAAGFDQDLTGLNIKRVTKSPVGNFRLDAEFAILPSSSFLYFVDTSRIRKRKIDPAGRPVGVISSAFAAPLKSRELAVPRFAATPQSNGVTKGLLVAIEDPSQLAGNGKIWIQRISAKGKPVGAPETVDSGFITASFLQIITLPSSTGERLKFFVIYVNGTQVTFPPQGEFSELIQLNLTVPLE